MFFIIFIGIAIGVYVYTFKEDFTKEHLDKAIPFIVIIVAGLFILGILASIVGAR